MLADIGNRVGENGVMHARHGNKEVIAQAAFSKLDVRRILVHTFQYWVQTRLKQVEREKKLVAGGAQAGNLEIPGTVNFQTVVEFAQLGGEGFKGRCQAENLQGGVVQN